jgi:hypothetical protein
VDFRLRAAFPVHRLRGQQALIVDRLRPQRLQRGTGFVDALHLVVDHLEQRLARPLGVLSGDGLPDRARDADDGLPDQPHAGRDEDQVRHNALERIGEEAVFPLRFVGVLRVRQQELGNLSQRFRQRHERRAERGRGRARGLFRRVAERRHRRRVGAGHRDAEGVSLGRQFGNSRGAFVEEGDQVGAAFAE